MLPSIDAGAAQTTSHPFLPKARALADTAARIAPELRLPLERWVGEGEEGDWDTGNIALPSDFLFGIGSTARAGLRVSVRLDFTASTLRVRFDTHDVTVGAFSTIEEVGEAGQALIEMAKIARRLERALRAGCKAAGFKLT